MQTTNTPTSLQAVIDKTATKIQQRKSSTFANNTQGGQQELATRIGKALDYVMSEVIPVFTLYTPDFAKKYTGKLEPVAHEYAKRIVKHGLTRKDIQRGLEKLKTRSAQNRWSVNPEEFAALCKPTASDLGIPDQDQALAEVIAARSPSRSGSGKKFEFSHRVVELINQRIGFEVRQRTHDNFKALFAKEYAHWLERAINGDLPEPRIAIEQKREPELPEYLKHAPKLDKSNPLHAKLLNIRQAIQQRQTQTA